MTIRVMRDPKKKSVSKMIIEYVFKKLKYILKKLNYKRDMYKLQKVYIRVSWSETR